MKTRMNYLGFFSLLALISILGVTTGNKGFFGFLGFLSYVRFFSVIPDELFRQNVQKAATYAFITEMIFLVPAMLIGSLWIEQDHLVPFTLALSFALAMIVFTVMIHFLLWQEQKDS